MNKSDYWTPFVKGQIENGLKVVFIHLWNTEDHWFEGLHYTEEMVFQAFIGFNSFGMNLYSMGELLVKDVELLCKRYEENPDFLHAARLGHNKRRNHKFLS